MKKEINSGTVKALKESSTFTKDLEVVKKHSGTLADTEAIRVAVKFYADSVRSK